MRRDSNGDVDPGHLHFERQALNDDDVSYNLHLDYEVVKDPKEGKGMGLH